MGGNFDPNPAHGALFTGAGTPLGQLAACFVLPITDDMGRDPAGIFQSLRDAALIQQTGGGKRTILAGIAAEAGKNDRIPV